MRLRGWFDVRAQDVIILLLFAALISTGKGDTWEIALMGTLGLLQLVEPRLVVSRSPRFRAVFISAKLLIGYLLIGYTGGVSSPYYLILLLPVISAATALGVFGTLLFTLVSCAAYLSFLLYIDFSLFVIEPEQLLELTRRVVFLGLSGTLVHTLAGAVRDQYLKYQRTANELDVAQRNLSRSERLAALGQLSAGLAHELRNPLGTIKASGELLARSVSHENGVARELAGFITSEADRTNSLVTRFLDFARPLSLRLSPTTLGSVIDRAFAETEREAAARGVRLVRDETVGLPPLKIDAELMERVFVNLTMNAIQASPAGASVTLKASLAGSKLAVEVIDHGSGIDPALADTIFNPFVTTKSEGTGLGLAIVSKIVDEHGGRVFFESEPGHGTTFHVQLPLGPKAE